MRTIKDKDLTGTWVLRNGCKAVVTHKEGEFWHGVVTWTGGSPIKSTWNLEGNSGARDLDLVERQRDYAVSQVGGGPTPVPVRHDGTQDKPIPKTVVKFRPTKRPARRNR